MKPNFKLLIGILLILTGLYYASDKMYCIYSDIEGLKAENVILQKEVSQAFKILAHREKMASIWANRYDFLRYQLSASNVRISILEQAQPLKDHEWERPAGKG